MNRKPTAPTEEIEEEDGYVNSTVCSVNKTAATPDQKFGSFIRSSSPVAGCWVILIVIMALRIYFTSVISAETTQRNNQLNENLTTLLEINLNLTNINHQLNATVKNLMVQFDKLNKSCAALTTNKMTEKVQDMESEFNVSRAQWSIDQYCPLKRDVRVQCYPCQVGWSQEKSSCYTASLSLPDYQKTWDEAQADCKEKISNLAVINNDREKEYIVKMGWNNKEINGYWIGLRVVDGKWTWVDGSDLTDISWIQPATPTEGHCAISVQNQGLKSVSCGDRYAWICEKKALSIAPVM
ncbi:asialoglycoprotein receptor 1-like isoform X1 [Acanthopagrus latus]|uniref:asialoglycoprotein receptor 1-like isoform X1 n=1 Tax=Acanthopagrus latus TaxID=8177 RepID=UPI00187C4E44|nr:asialoglycoprotein receptor 1-like isoform X1 [Acanthopagrus latus]